MFTTDSLTYELFLSKFANYSQQMSILDINQRHEMTQSEKSLHLQATKNSSELLLQVTSQRIFSREEFNLISEKFYNAFNFTVVKKISLRK